MLFNWYWCPDTVVRFYYTEERKGVWEATSNALQMVWRLSTTIQTHSWNSSWLEAQLTLVAGTPRLIFVWHENAKLPLGSSRPVSSAGRGSRMPLLSPMGQISWRKSFEKELHIVIENWVRNIFRDGQKLELHMCILLVLEKIPASKNNDYSNKIKT